MFKRLFSAPKSGSLNHLRNIPSNIYVEYVDDFKSLSNDEQEYLFHRTYLIFLVSMTGFSYDQYKEFFRSLPGFSLNLFLIKEKKYDTEIGINFFSFDKMYLNDNDCSNKNLYLSTYNGCALVPHYRGGGLGRLLIDLVESKARKEFPDINRVSYNATLNPFFYEYKSELTPLMFPGPNIMPTDGPERLIRKFMKRYGDESISEDRPYVIHLPLEVPGADIKRYQGETVFKSKAREYYIKQTGFEYGHLLANLAIFSLVDDNTLGIKGGSYEKIPEINFEIVKYKPKFR